MDCCEAKSNIKLPYPWVIGVGGLKVGLVVGGVILKS